MFLFISVGGFWFDLVFWFYFSLFVFVIVLLFFPETNCWIKAKREKLNLLDSQIYTTHFFQGFPLSYLKLILSISQHILSDPYPVEVIPKHVFYLLDLEKR